MAIGTFGSFTQARLAIYAAQTGLSITGNNISNINTAGYTRQRLDQDSLHVGGTDRYANKNDIRTGQGVLCTGVSQLRDPYLDIRYRSASAETGYRDAFLGGLETLAHYLDEVGKGEQTEGEGFGILGAKMLDLFKGLGQVTAETNHAEFDRQVKSYAQTMVTEMHRYASALEEAYNNAVGKYKEDVVEVNDILNSIRDLNEEIRRCEIYSDPALELRDHRNVLIDKLSSYVKINAWYTTEEIAPGLTVEKLMIDLGDSNYDASVTTDETRLIDGIYGGQLLMATPMMNTAYNPDMETNDPEYNPDVTPFKYMVWKKDADGKYVTDTDGKPVIEKYTNDIREATMLEDENNPNFGLSVSELRNKRGELLYTMSTPTVDNTLTETDYNTKLAAGKLSEEDVDTVTGDKKITTYNKVVDKKTGHPTYYKMEYTLKASQKVGLMDNDIYGALQADRELITEDGEFTDTHVYAEGGNVNDPLYSDGNAKSKRGIPYYRNCLDMLANKLAEVFNSCNDGFYYDQDGNYVQRAYDEKGNPILHPETGLMTGGPVGIEYTDGTAKKTFLLNKNTDWNAPDVWNNKLPPEVRDELQNKTNLTFSENPVAANETSNGEKIIQAYLMLPMKDEAGNVIRDKDGNVCTIGVRADGAGPLLSNNNLGDNTTNITASNIALSNSWSSNGVTMVKSFECAPGHSEPATGQSSNVLHLSYVLATQKFDYIPQEYFKTQNATTDVMFNGTFNEMFENMQSVLGNDQERTQILLTTAYESATSIDTQRDSVSAVDFNDEAMNLMMYAKSYNAACRLMTTIDTVLDKLINNTGVTT